MAIPVGTEKQYQIKDGYIISVVIGEYDYEADVTSIRIVTSLNSSYPVYVIRLNLRPIEILQHKILGQEVIKLSIKHIDISGNSELDQPYEIDLMYLSGSFDIPSSNQLLTNADSLQDLAPYTMRCVPEAAFLFMTTTMNFIFRESKIPNIFSFISNKGIDKIKNKTNTKISVFFDALSPYINKRPVPQIILPPTIIKNQFDYLLEEFGMFSTWGCIFASIAEDTSNKIYINALDIGYQFESGENLFNLRQLAIDTEDSKTDTYGYDNFYITTPITTKYIANTTIGNIGNNIKYIHKPIDRFSRFTVDSQVEDEILMNELAFDSLPDFMYFLDDINEPYLTTALENRIRYDTSHIAHYKDEKDKSMFQDKYWLESNINKKVMNFSQLNCKLEKHIPIFKFTDIGKMVTFKSETLEYKPYNGKYILFSSDMSFRRSKTWEMTVDINLIRPKWSMGKDD